ncbi:hypothetical protein J4N45_21010 [Vibrio sp. SCSIO 43140]|uniref:hypothetical protein n=1 Tax=Vibrio sp. SCSIO 43140 TaxID=2819100 RepID=UPI00207590DB|nr:hypothetical protein [Vibrio sp. SCSIO 43140]USD63463.1 hypothetical protein J4N45_21010 [Vibrio sp. SCSIO 43140]
MSKLNRWYKSGFLCFTFSTLTTITLIVYTQFIIEQRIAKKLEYKSDAFEKLSLSYASLDGMLNHLDYELVGPTFSVDQIPTFISLVESTKFQIVNFNYPADTSNYDAVIILDETAIGIVLTYHHTINLRAILSFFFVHLVLSYLVLDNVLKINLENNTVTEGMREGVESLTVQLDLTSKELGAFKSVAAHRDMDNHSFRWFVWAYRKTGCIERATSVASQEDTLEFDIKNRVVFIRGIELELPKTPFFYYYWYAKRKASNLAPFTNPAVNKPDLFAGIELARIMAKHNGIGRTIEELNSVGLRAKNLDLNRSKIKEKLGSELGDLSSPYLFESNRDIRTSRYQYQLVLPSENIRFLT